MSSWDIPGGQRLRGTFRAPGDKSISHRAVLLGALAEGDTRISNYLAADDCLRTLDALQQCGISATRSDSGGGFGETLTITGGELSEPGDALNLGNSGTGLRLLAGVLAGQPFLSVLTGDASIRRRPMKRIAEPLRKMGATILTRAGDVAPIVIRGGGLHGIEHRSPVASAQVKSCVLLAGLFAVGETTVMEPSLSRDHTERMLRYFGADLVREETAVTIRPGAVLKGREINVAGDFSSAAFFIVGALITPNSEVEVTAVGLNPTRTGLLDALLEMGADITVRDKAEMSGEPVGTIVARTSRLRGQTFGGTLIPRMIDEVPLLALAASVADGQTVIKDAEELAVKESNRLETTAEMLRAFGASAAIDESSITIRGGATLRAAKVDSHGDHRIAMASSIAALSAPDPSRIDDCDCVGTSFPSFRRILDDLTS